jgi:hypothetical protein
MGSGNALATGGNIPRGELRRKARVSSACKAAAHEPPGWGQPHPWELRQWFELQSIYNLSCKCRAHPSDTILSLHLQPDSGSSCNWYTLRVANTECFCLILYHPFSCNRIVVRVAIDVHSDIQIQSAFSCNRTVVRVAIDVHSKMQILSDSAWYCTTPPLQLQPDCGPSCNWYILWVANTERFRLILYYPFSCNPTVVRVAIGTHSELQIINPHQVKAIRY